MDMLLAAERVHGGGGGGRKWARERARRRQRSWGFIQELIENGRRSRLTQTAASGSMKKNNDTSHERTTRIFPLTRKPLSLRVRPDTCQAETQVLEAREQLLDLERPSASASAKRPGARRPARGRHMGTYGFRTCGRERRFSDWSPTRLAPGPGDPRETGGAREPREPRRGFVGRHWTLLTRRDHRTSEAEEERTTLEALRGYYLVVRRLTHVRAFPRPPLHTQCHAQTHSNTRPRLPATNNKIPAERATLLIW